MKGCLSEMEAHGLATADVLQNDAYAHGARDEAAVVGGNDRNPEQDAAGVEVAAGKGWVSRPGHAGGGHAGGGVPVCVELTPRDAADSHEAAGVENAC